MATRIVCTARESTGIAHDSDHFVEVGVGSTNGEPSSTKDLATVLDTLADGETYYAEVDGARTEVVAGTCSCGADTLRPDPDSDGPNALARLPEC